LPSIPEYHTWIVTICHFGADACKEYTGDKFCVTWEVGEYVLIRAYNKEMNAGGNKNKKPQNYNQTREAGMPRHDLRGCHCRKIGGGER